MVSDPFSQSDPRVLLASLAITLENMLAAQELADSESASALQVQIVSRAERNCTSRAERNCTTERRGVSIKVPWSVRA